MFISVGILRAPTAALLVSLVIVALPGAANAAHPGTAALGELASAQQLAQQITGSALSQAHAPASVAREVTAAIGGDAAPPPATAGLPHPAAATTHLPSPRAGTAPTRVLHVAVRGVARRAVRTQPRGVARRPVRTQPRAMPTTRPRTQHRARRPATSNESFIRALALAGLAGDTGLLQTISIPGLQLPGTAPVPVPTELTTASLLDRPSGYAAVNNRARRASAAKRGLAGPVAAPPAVPHPLAFPAASSGLLRTPRAASRPRASPAPSAVHEHAHERAPAQHPVPMPVQAGPLLLTLSTGGPAVGAAGATASGAGAVALTALFVLAFVQLLSDRLSLELVPWRSALLALRLERPG
jgi:hypothetical protein